MPLNKCRDIIYSQKEAHGFENNPYWGFPGIRCTFLGVPIMRIKVFGGLYWGPHVQGNSHMDFNGILGS